MFRDVLSKYNHRAVAAVLLGALAGVLGSLVVSFAQTGVGGPDAPREADEVPIPVFNRWIRPDTGRFEAYVWDDRALPESEKALTPWYDARWEPFAGCMARSGYEVRPEPSEPFSQTDLDKLIGLVNAAQPDTQANKLISGPEDVDGIAQAFLRCADPWLTIPSEDLGLYGLRWLAPGEIPRP